MKDEKTTAPSAQMDELRRTIAEIAGFDPETWPAHGNAPLAIAASYALLKRRVDQLERQIEGDNPNGFDGPGGAE